MLITCVFNLYWYRGAPEAQLVGHTKRSAANHMEASLCKSHDDLQFAPVLLCIVAYCTAFCLKASWSVQDTFCSFCLANLIPFLENAHMMSKAYCYRQLYLLFFLLFQMAGLFCSSETLIKKSCVCIFVFSLPSSVCDRATCRPTRSAESWC